MRILSSRNRFQGPNRCSGVTTSPMNTVMGAETSRERARRSSSCCGPSMTPNTTLKMISSVSAFIRGCAANGVSTGHWLTSSAASRLIMSR